VIQFVAELDPAVFVLDCLPNMGAKDVRERTAPGVKMLRAAHPRTPILLVEDRNMETGFLVQARRDANEANHAALRRRTIYWATTARARSTGRTRRTWASPGRRRSSRGSCGRF
jgi:hypothetical protein